MPAAVVYNAIEAGRTETAAIMLLFDDTRFDLQCFATARLILLVNIRHLPAVREQVSFRELTDEQFVLFSDDFRINEIIRNACGIYHYKPVAAGRSNHPDLIMAMVSAGVGLTLLPESMWHAHRTDGLAAVSVTDPACTGTGHAGDYAGHSVMTEKRKYTK